MTNWSRFGRLPCPARMLLLTCAVALAPMTLGTSSAQTAYDFGGYPGYEGPQYRGYTTQALYVPARDGTKLAIDVYLPKGLAPDTQLPTIMKISRYWRATALRWPFRLLDHDDFVEFFTSNGYAVVKMDVRGTGASFGTWLLPYMPEQVQDAGWDVVQWITEQPWSNGKVGAQGISYGGNTAAFLPVPNHPAVKAVVPRFIEFDQFSNLPFPGGICNRGFIQLWNEANWALDTNDLRKLVQLQDGGWLMRWALLGVKPVDADRDRSMLRAAIIEHAGNSDLMVLANQVTYRDDVPDGMPFSINTVSLHAHREAVERSGAAYYVWGSWTDASTADAALSHFFTHRNPERAVIGAWSHGARFDADQFKPADAPLSPSRRDQLLDCLRFLDHYLKGVDNGIMTDRVLHYYTMGDGWHTTTVWPPENLRTQPWYLQADGGLRPAVPTTNEGADTYTVDFTATTGTTNRWYTQLDGQDVVYDTRAEQIAKTLAYRSAPLQRDMTLTGHPIVTLYLSSTETDGAIYVYLDAEGPDGRIVYLTDGQLRVLHRKVSDANPPYTIFVPYHSFMRKDGMPLVPGQLAEISFGLRPTSARIPAGWRLRLSIAGHDADNFVRLPADGTPTLTVYHDAGRPSRVELPIIAP